MTRMISKAFWKKPPAALICLVAILCGKSIAAAQNTDPLEVPPDPFARIASPGVDMMTTASTANKNDLLNYCLDISDAAKEARAAILKDKLSKTEKQVAEKLDLLEKRIGELKAWMAKRDKFKASASDTMLKLYKEMRPDAAASQIKELNPFLAAAIIAKLDAKSASPILAEMDAETAAKITSLIASSAGGGQ